MSSDRNPTTFLRLDIVLILSVLGLITIGIAFIYSSGVTSEGVLVSGEWFRQIIWAATGILLMVIFALIDYRKWKQWSLPAYGGVLLLLVLVLLVGNYVKGARARLGIGPVGIQPSEFGKLAVIVLLAWWFEDRGRGQDGVRTWLSAIVMTAVPMMLILAQPDLGTAVVYIPIFLAISFAAGVDWKLLLFPLLAGLLMILGILGYAWSEHIAHSSVSFFLLFTDWRVGVMAVLPNAFPVVVLFGFMGYSGIPLNIGTAMAAAIASV